MSVTLTKENLPILRRNPPPEKPRYTTMPTLPMVEGSGLKRIKAAHSQSEKKSRRRRKRKSTLPQIQVIPTNSEDEVAVAEPTVARNTLPELLAYIAKIEAEVMNRTKKAEDADADSAISNNKEERKEDAEVDEAERMHVEAHDIENLTLIDDAAMIEETGDETKNLKSYSGDQSDCQAELKSQGKLTTLNDIVITEEATSNVNFEEREVEEDTSDEDEGGVCLIKPGQEAPTEIIQDQGTMTGSEKSKNAEEENASGADTKKEVEILKRETESLTRKIKLPEERKREVDRTLLAAEELRASKMNRLEKIS
ncbi:hypothetical protein BOTCAL_0070g00130 [Botryotinia calthae]|uniref:Uncharacterized protein n=1 Tax=Botryotinia calthae TaxID=38488 RepID=A0A4Y8DBG6_9HELO|nr:hypothetical protein BOTCAL_0070g00130 [Botryotinia calthae]